MKTCPVCGTRISGKNRFCSRACVREGYRVGLVVNSGLFKKGHVSLNKGRTLESWVGEARAKEIRARMSRSSAKKAPFLRLLNSTPGIGVKRARSRRSHDDVVLWLAKRFRSMGLRVFTLSEYVREKRIPDAIVFDGKRLIAVEVETEKRWKPSHRTTEERLGRLNALCGFFDETAVVFPPVPVSPQEVGPDYVRRILGWERLNSESDGLGSGG